MQQTASNMNRLSYKSAKSEWAAPYRAMSGTLSEPSDQPRITLSPIAAQNDCTICCVEEGFDLTQYYAKLRAQYQKAGWPLFVCETLPETNNHRHVLVLKGSEIIGGLSFSIAEDNVETFLEDIGYGNYIPALGQQIDLSHTSVLKGHFLEQEARDYYVKNAFWQFVYTYVLATGKAIALIEAPTLPRRLDIYYEHNGWRALSPLFYNPAGARWLGDNEKNARIMARPLHGLIPMDCHSIREIDAMHPPKSEPVLTAQHA